MSAKDQMTKLLDQLMGQNRDGEEGSRKHFNDKDVCRPFLLSICIADLFTNTRAELPECDRVHSETLRQEYNDAVKTRDFHFDEEVLEYLRGFLRDNDRKIESAKRRLAQSEDSPEMEAKVQEIHELAVEIGEKVAKAEKLGADGNVEESIAVMKDLEDVKSKKKLAEDDYHAMIPRHAAQQQKLRACEVCGAFLSMYDNDRRLADHFGGKLHIGFVTIRDKIKLLEERIQEKEEQRIKEREEFYKEKERERERREKEREEREKERTRDRDRDRRDRDRNRERDGHRRSRSRSRERRPRDSYRDREDGYRDRRSSGARDMDRRRRSRSRERR